MNVSRCRTLLALVIVALPLRADVVTIEADRDNTLYESPTGALSNGRGFYFFAGLTNNDERRRGLLHFDVASVLPAGAQVSSVQLELYTSKVQSVTPKNISVHRALGDWGQGNSAALGQEGAGGASAPGDATWLHRFYPDTFWTTVGGDFAAQASASLMISQTGPSVWSSTPRLVADVQQWVDAPTQNFGWLLLGEEDGGSSARRFDTREHLTASHHPRLTVTFEVPDCVPQDFLDLGSALAGTHGAPQLVGASCLEPGEALTLQLSNALENASFSIVAGASAIHAPLRMGVLVPAPTLLRFGFSTDASGAHSLVATWPAGVPSGFEIFVQHWIVDPLGPAGFAASNALRATTP
ncbi:MAG: hypothetical protein DHS20C15_31770 [Planctomycetota bacterium]|nr:MAG: hypothetical protein DHS20C15_31770 [Planctomycetota bacterium]